MSTETTTPQTELGAATKKTASFISDIRTIVVGAMAVVATIFFAGVYYRDALVKIEEYRNKIDAMEKQLTLTNAELKALKTSLNAGFLKFVSENINSGPPIKNTEPANNGGGYSPDAGQGRCPQGTFVVGIQPYKYPDGTRQINFQCAVLPKIEIK